MNCLRVREYCGSVHSLHRAFDCISSDDTKGDENSRNFRYAALNLGSLLCRFGFGYVYHEFALLFRLS